MLKTIKSLNLSALGGTMTAGQSLRGMTAIVRLLDLVLVVVVVSHLTAKYA